MAERRSARGKQDLTPDELAPAADERGDALTIVGVLGESTDTGSVRVFLDAQFQTYYEIPRDAILRRTRVPAERSPLGIDCSAVVVRRGTELAVHRAETRRVEEEFLAGDFTAPRSFTPVENIPPPGPISAVGCPSDTEVCATGIFGCPPPTLEFGCFLTRQIGCGPSRLLCPITVDINNCPVVTRAPSLCCVSRLRCPSVGRCPSEFCVTVFCDPGTIDPGPIR
jgi:hypothetical protein